MHVMVHIIRWRDRRRRLDIDPSHARKCGWENLEIRCSIIHVKKGAGKQSELNLMRNFENTYAIAHAKEGGIATQMKIRTTPESTYALARAESGPRDYRNENLGRTPLKVHVLYPCKK